MTTENLYTLLKSFGDNALIIERPSLYDPETFARLTINQTSITFSTAQDHSVMISEEGITLIHATNDLKAEYKIRSDNTLASQKVRKMGICNHRQGASVEFYTSEHNHDSWEHAILKQMALPVDEYRVEADRSNGVPIVNDSIPQNFHGRLVHNKSHSASNNKPQIKDAIIALNDNLTEDTGIQGVAELFNMSAEELTALPKLLSTKAQKYVSSL